MAKQTLGSEARRDAPPSMAGFCRASQDLGSQDGEAESTPISRMAFQVWIGPWQPDHGSCVPLFHDQSFLGQIGPGDPGEENCTPFLHGWSPQDRKGSGVTEPGSCTPFLCMTTSGLVIPWGGCKLLFFVCGSTFRTWALAEGQVSPHLSR